jgi:hypothetical protein
MKLTDTDIGSFKEAWFEATGQQITDDQARIYAPKLLALVQFAIEPSIPRRDEPP